MSEKILSAATIEHTRKMLLCPGLLTGGGQDLVKALIASHQELDQKYRRALYLSHGCDEKQRIEVDGEMLCGAHICPMWPCRHPKLDFRRDSILHLETELGKMKLTESGIIIPGLNDDMVKA